MGKIQPNINTDLYKLNSKEFRRDKHSGGSIIPIPLEQVAREFDDFEAINFANSDHKKALMELFPAYLLEQRNQVDWELFVAMNRYDNKSRTLITGCFDNSSLEEMKIISYKYRYKNGIKWKTRAGTSPNSTPFVRICSDYDNIYIIEGHRDALTAILLGLDLVMIPTASFHLRDSTYLQNEIRNRNVVLLVEDESAYKCMRLIANSLSKNASRILITDLSVDESKLDLSDFVQNFQSIGEAVYELRSQR